MEQDAFHTIEADKFQEYSWSVFKWSIWEKGSLLAGQQKKVYVNTFDSLEEAEKAYPEANGGTGYTNTFDHLPAEEMTAREEEEYWGEHR